ncbi:MAG: glycosyl hydrolase family 17 protein [Planctomycetes bacterium]|nr:glycosyl hydrolase family 17 protein [Planctomycetota bacterium]
MKKLNFLIVWAMATAGVFGLFGCGGGGGGDGKNGGAGGWSGQISYVVHGLNFSPYTGNQDPNLGSVVSENQIRNRLAVIDGYTDWIRTFGSTQGLEHAARIAKTEFGIGTAIGAWLGTSRAANDREMANLIAAAKAGFVDLAIVGSETLLRGDLTADELIAYIERFRQEVPNVPVTTADVYYLLWDNPAVMAACDVTFFNYHPYWEGRDVDQAVAYLHSIYLKLVSLAGGKEVIVSETGWPSGGSANGAAVPSLGNASFHFLNFVSWARAEGVPYFYFEAFDEPWKAAYEGDVGDKWGVWYGDGALKPGMADVFAGLDTGNNWSCGALPGGPGTPQIVYAYVPAYGSYDNLSGQVWHVDPSQYGVAVYIKVGGGWWTKPYWASPVTWIDCSGSWTCDITTGGNDALATAIASYLIPANYDPPSAGGGALPVTELEANAVAWTVVNR